MALPTRLSQNAGASSAYKDCRFRGIGPVGDLGRGAIVVRGGW